MEEMKLVVGGESTTRGVWKLVGCMREKVITDIPCPLCHSLLLITLLRIAILNILQFLNSYLDLLNPTVKTLGLEYVQVDWERKSNRKSNQWNEECMLGITAHCICNGTQNRGEQCTSAHGSHDKTRSTLAVSSKTTKRECKDQRKVARFED